MRAFLTWFYQIKVTELFLKWKLTCVYSLSFLYRCPEVRFGNQDSSVPSTAKTLTLSLPTTVAQPLSKSALLALISFFIAMLLALCRSCVSNFFLLLFSRRVSN